MSTRLRPVLGQLFCPGIQFIYFVILMCLCVRCVCNLNIPKVALKNIEYFLSYDDILYF